MRDSKAYLKGPKALDAYLEALKTGPTWGELRALLATIDEPPAPEDVGGTWEDRGQPVGTGGWSPVN